MESQSILVTGGAGFIGSHLCERLLKENFSVICLDSLDDFYDPEVKKDNISEALKNRNFAFIRGDILDSKLLKAVFSKYNIRRVVHLAAVAGVRASLANPQRYVDVNIKGTVNLLEASVKYKVEQFIFGSSSSVYGINSKIPFAEDDIVDLQISPYAVSKRSAELFCATYHRLYGIPITILRFFTVYGPRQRPDMAIHKFTRLINSGKPVPVFGYGEYERDYTYVDDAVEGIIKAIHKKFDFEIFNIGSSEKAKVKDLIEIISVKLGIKPKIQLYPEQPGDVPVTYADISKARKMLAYNPSTSIDEGIGRFINWYLTKKDLLEK